MNRFYMQLSILFFSLVTNFEEIKTEESFWVVSVNLENFSISFCYLNADYG